MKIRSFTILELVIVSIIIGILATLAVNYYGPYKERTLDREAQANLRLILAAERIYRMENAFYYPINTESPVTAIPDINTFLKILLSQATPVNWNYKIESSDSTPAATDFIAKAQRTTDATRVWCINQGTENPYQAACSWE